MSNPQPAVKRYKVYFADFVSADYEFEELDNELFDPPNWKHVVMATDYDALEAEHKKTLDYVQELESEVRELKRRFSLRLVKLPNGEEVSAEMAEEWFADE